MIVEVWLRSASPCLARASCRCGGMHLTVCDALVMRRRPPQNMDLGTKNDKYCDSKVATGHFQRPLDFDVADDKDIMIPARGPQTKFSCN